MYGYISKTTKRLKRNILHELPLNSEDKNEV